MSKRGDMSKLELKLALWMNPGFLLFLEDLEKYEGEECHIITSVNTLKALYRRELDDMVLNSDKFKQGKLDL